MLDWLKRLVSDNTSPDAPPVDVAPPMPTVGIKTHPVEVNAQPSARQIRNEARMARLRAAIASGDTRTSLLEELTRREKEGR